VSHQETEIWTKRWFANKYVHDIYEQLLLYVLKANGIAGRFKGFLNIGDNGNKVYFSFLHYYNKDQILAIDSIKDFEDPYYFKKMALVKEFPDITYIVFTHEDLKNPPKAFEEKFKNFNMKEYI